jgi:predicted RNA-binding Zn ribbon-like protein
MLTGVSTTAQPGERAPAPGVLSLIQDFVNSRNLEAGTDRLVDAGALQQWLLERGLIAKADRVSDADLRDALELREALRAVLLAHNGVAVPVDEARAFERIAAGSPLRAQIGEGGVVQLAPAAAGAAGALARLVGIAANATVDGTWQRLKACRGDDCHWAFYDHSKNRSGHWCTMRLCGTRTKMRRYRRSARSRSDA